MADRISTRPGSLRYLAMHHSAFETDYPDVARFKYLKALASRLRKLLIVNVAKCIEHHCAFSSIIGDVAT